MGMGSESSAAGGGTGGGMGLGLLSGLFGAIGGSGSGQTSPSTTPYYIENPNVGHGGPGPDLWAKIGQVLQDPEVLKALGNTTKNLGSTIGAANEIPPHAAIMLNEAIKGSGQQASPTTGSGPFLGDIPNFTPQQAQTLLQAMGIPGGFTPLTRNNGY